MATGRTWALTAANKTAASTLLINEVAGTDYPVVGDVVFVTLAADSTATAAPGWDATPFTVNGTGSVGAISTSTGGSYSSGAGARVLTARAVVTADFGPSTSITANLSGSTTAKAGVVSAITATNGTTGITLGGANQAGAWSYTLAASDRAYFAATATENNAAPGLTGGVALGSAVTSGGGGAASHVGLVVGWAHSPTHSAIGADAASDGARIVLYAMDGVATQNGVAALVSASVLTVPAVVTYQATATMASTSTLTAGATRGQPAAAAMTSTSMLSAAAAPLKEAAAALVSSSTLTTTATRVKEGAAALSSSSTLSAAATVQGGGGDTTVVSDDFNRADSTDVGGGWSWGVGGGWQIIGNRLALPSGAGGIVLGHGTSVGDADHWVETELSVNTSESEGVVGRAGSAFNDFYLWRTDGTTWTLFNATGGSYTAIGSVSQGRADGDIARLEFEGSTIRGLRNGNVLVEVTDTAHTGTYVGIRAYASSTARYDNFAAGTFGGGAVTHQGVAALSSSSSLTAGAVRAQPAVAALTSSSTLTSGAVRAQPAAAALVSSSALAAAAVVTKHAVVALTSSSTLTAAAVRAAPATAALVSSSALSAAAVRAAPATAGLVSSSTLTVAGAITRHAVVAFVSSSTLMATAAGIVTHNGVAALVATSALTASGLVTRAAAAALVSTSVLTAAAVRGQSAVVALTASSTLLAGAVVTRHALAALVSSSALAAAASTAGQSDAAVALVSSSTLTVAGVTERHAVAALVALSELAVAAVVQAHAEALLESVSDLTIGMPVLEQGALVALVSVSLLNAHLFSGGNPRYGSYVELLPAPRHYVDALRTAVFASFVEQILPPRRFVTVIEPTQGSVELLS